MKWYSPNGRGGTYSGELVLDVIQVEKEGFTVRTSSVTSTPKGE